MSYCYIARGEPALVRSLLSDGFPKYGLLDGFEIRCEESFGQARGYSGDTGYVNSLRHIVFTVGTLGTVNCFILDSIRTRLWPIMIGNV